ncbi:MAG: flagellar basal-body rod protein FlgF [Pseudomonadota bacterium]
MDRLIYVAMSGAKMSSYQQEVVAHNLANSSTTGFRAEVSAFRALPTEGPGMKTRVYAVDSTVGADFTPGSMQTTGRSLDVGILSEGWIAVQGADGKEAYTRNGSLEITTNGVLQTRGGLNVLGEGGPLSIPPDTEITIAADGTISTVPSGQVSTVSVVGQIKLVNPPKADLVKGEDGLFRLKNGNAATSDVNVKLASGTLESSNVNVVEALTSMITQSRHFDMQIKLLQNADANARQASQILNMNA